MPNRRVGAKSSPLDTVAPQNVNQHVSPDAREFLKNQIMRAERHVIANAILLAVESNDDVVLQSHMEAACNEVLSKRAYKKRLGVAITISAVVGAIIQSFFGGVGKSYGEYVLHLF